MPAQATFGPQLLLHPSSPYSLPAHRYINGYTDRAPVRPNISLGDSLAGLHAAFGVAMALLHRHKAGQGQVRWLVQGLAVTVHSRLWQFVD